MYEIIAVATLRNNNKMTINYTLSVDYILRINNL